MSSYLQKEFMIRRLLVLICLTFSLIQVSYSQAPSQDDAELKFVVYLSRHGVLVGSTGRDSNVLKIRPPLTIARAEADSLINALERSLRAEA